MWKFILRRWQQATQPSPALQNPLDQYRAQFTASVMLVSLSLLLLHKVFHFISQNPEDTITGVVTTIIIVLLSVGYGFSRTVRYPQAVLIVVIPLPILIVAQSFVERVFDPSGFLFLTVFLATIYHALNGRYMERMNAQLRDLQESEARYHTLVEAGFDGMVVHENSIILDANEGFLRIMGYRLDEVRGQFLYHFFAPVSEDESTKADNSTHFEMTAVRKDGSSFRIEIYRKAVMYHDRSAEVLAFHDLTEQKRVEQERLEFTAERERSEVLRQFISDASHDLRTPLATINTSLYLLRKTVPDMPNVARHLDSLQAQAVHLNEVLESLLLMARLDDPDTYFDLTQLDLNQIAHDVTETSQPRARQKKQMLEFCANGALPFVQGDTDEIKRAIRLLLDNALQYTPEGGKIIVEVRHLHQIAIIEIRDNGPGISPEDLPHIFERFYRGDKARSQTQNVGAGLGLPVAKKIIEAHGGSIDVKTQFGLGSTFQIILPLKKSS